MSTLNTSEVLTPILLRSSTPAPSEKVLLYLEGIQRSGGASPVRDSMMSDSLPPSEYGFDPTDPQFQARLNNIRNRAPSQHRSSALSRQAYTADNDDVDYLENSEVTYENIDHEISSNIQEGIRSDIAKSERTASIHENDHIHEHYTGHEHVPEEPRYVSNGSSFGNTGPPRDSYFGASPTQSTPMTPQYRNVSRPISNVTPLRTGTSAPPVEPMEPPSPHRAPWGQHVLRPIGRASAMSPRSTDLDITIEAPSDPSNHSSQVPTQVPDPTSSQQNQAGITVSIGPDGSTTINIPRGSQSKPPSEKAVTEKGLTEKDLSEFAGDLRSPRMKSPKPISSVFGSHRPSNAEADLAAAMLSPGAHSRALKSPRSGTRSPSRGPSKAPSQAPAQSQMSPISNFQPMHDFQSFGALQQQDTGAPSTKAPSRIGHSTRATSQRTPTSIRDQSIREQSIRDQSIRDQSIRDQSIRDQSTREQSLRDQTIREQSEYGTIPNDYTGDSAYPYEHNGTRATTRATTAWDETETGWGEETEAYTITGNQNGYQTGLSSVSGQTHTQTNPQSVYQQLTGHQNEYATGLSSVSGLSRSQTNSQSVYPQPTGRQSEYQTSPPPISGLSHQKTNSPSVYQQSTGNQNEYQTGLPSVSGNSRSQTNPSSAYQQPTGHQDEYPTGRTSISSHNRPQTSSQGVYKQPTGYQNEYQTGPSSVSGISRPQTDIQSVFRQPTGHQNEHQTGPSSVSNHSRLQTNLRSVYQQSSEHQNEYQTGLPSVSGLRHQKTNPSSVYQQSTGNQNEYQTGLPSVSGNSRPQTNPPSLYQQSTGHQNEYQTGLPSVSNHSRPQTNLRSVYQRSSEHQHPSYKQNPPPFPLPETYGQTQAPSIDSRMSRLKSQASKIPDLSPVPSAPQTLRSDHDDSLATPRIQSRVDPPVIPRAESRGESRVEDEELNDYETEIVQGILSSRTPRTSMIAPSVLAEDVKRSQYHDEDLCILLHAADNEMQHEVVRKALRKAVAARIRKLGFKSDREGIKQYRKKFHDHDPSWHVTNEPSFNPENPPSWAREMMTQLRTMEDRMAALGPQLAQLKPNETPAQPPQSHLHTHTHTYHGLPPVAAKPDSVLTEKEEELEAYDEHTPRTLTIPIGTQITGAGESTFRPPETEYTVRDRNRDRDRETLSGSLHRLDRSAVRSREPDEFEDASTRVPVGPAYTDRTPPTQDSEYRPYKRQDLLSQSGRGESPGQQVLEEELYRLRAKEQARSVAMTHQSWELHAESMDERRDSEVGHDIPESEIPDIEDPPRQDSPPLPPIPAEQQEEVPETTNSGAAWQPDYHDVPPTPPWQRIHQRLLNWAIVWPMTELDAAIASTQRACQADEVALSIWSTQMYKRYVRQQLTEIPPGRVDRLFVPPNMADAINNAVFHGRHGDACGMLRDLWTPFGLEGMPRIIVVLCKHRSDPNHWVSHKFSLPDGTLTTYDTYPEKCLPDGRPLGWWFAIRIAWPGALYPSPDHLMQKMVRLHRPHQLPIDNSVASAGIWRNLLMGSRAERPVDLVRLRDLIHTEVKNLRQRKEQGKLSISATTRPNWTWDEVGA